MPTYSGFIPVRDILGNFLIAGCDVVGDNDYERKGIKCKNTAIYKTTSLRVVRLYNLNNEFLHTEQGIYYSLIDSHDEKLDDKIELSFQQYTTNEKDKIKYFSTEFAAIDYIMFYYLSKLKYSTFTPKDNNHKFILDYCERNNGLFKNYYENGQICEMYEMKNWKRNGRYQSFDKKGNKTRDCIYKDDKLHGTSTEYKNIHLIFPKMKRATALESEGEKFEGEKLDMKENGSPLPSEHIIEGEESSTDAIYAEPHSLTSSDKDLKLPKKEKDDWYIIESNYSKGIKEGPFCSYLKKDDEERFIESYKVNGENDGTMYKYTTKKPNIINRSIYENGILIKEEVLFVPSESTETTDGKKIEFDEFKKINFQEYKNIWFCVESIEKRNGEDVKKTFVIL